MLTLEFRINGQLIDAVNIHNIAVCPESIMGELCRYEVTRLGSDANPIYVNHNRRAGARKLALEALKALEKKK